MDQEMVDVTVRQEENDDEPDVMDEEILEENNDAGFTIIGEVKETKLRPTKIPLPKWIQNAQTFSKDISYGSKPLDSIIKYISNDTLRKLGSQGIKAVFPVQAKVIPYLSSSLRSSNIICPPDVCVAAPTGSGKTLSFVIPIVEYLCTKVEPQIRVLVVVPVGHLAQQIKSVFDYYCKGTRIKTCCATGLRTMEEDFHQLMKRIFNGDFICAVDIVVCTPGRLVDLIQRAPGFDLSQLELIVMDEADRIESNEMEQDWISKVETKVYGSSQRNKCFCSNRDPGDRIVVNACCACSTINYTLSRKPIQKWLFSATLTNDPMKFQELNLYRPRLFRAADVTQDDIPVTNQADHALPIMEDAEDQSKSFTPSELEEKMIVTVRNEKPLVMWYLMSKLKFRKVLCFIHAVDDALRLQLLLEQIEGLVVRQMSSNVNAKEREKTIRKFSEGKIDILVCSDMMARGIDISDVDYVISYDPPRNPVAYIHRIGRTARAGRKGTAITLVSKEKMKDFRTIIWKAHKLQPGIEFPVKKMDLKKILVHNCKNEYEQALHNLPEKLKVVSKKQAKWN